MHATQLIASPVVTNMQTWPEYLRRVTGGLTPSEISKRSGIQLSTITRWLSGENRPTVAKVEVLAKHFPVKLDEALAIVAAFTPTPRAQIDGQIFQVGGYGYNRKRLLRMYSDLELATEIVRRIEDHDSVEYPQPFSDDDDDSGSGMIPFPTPNVGGPAEHEELDAVARPAETEPTDEQ